MAKTIKELNVSECIGTESLKTEIRKNLNTGKTLCIIGDAGVGKTVLMEEVSRSENFDKFFEIRMAGVASEDILGLPIKVKNVETGAEEVQFVKLDWMQYIKNHKDQKILLLLDELNRASTEIESGLFNILEGKIDGEYYPNLQVIACINHGDAYETNLEFGDIAFRRRVTFVKYTPDKRDAITFIKAKEYHPDLITACESRDINMLDYSFQNDDAHVYEQPTTYGSYSAFNKRLINCARLKGYGTKIGGFYDEHRLVLSREEYDEKIAAMETLISDKLAALEAELKKKKVKVADRKVQLAETETKLRSRQEKFTEITEENYHWTLPTQDVLMEMKGAGTQYFNELVARLMVQKLSDINSLRTLDVVKEVIAKGKIDQEYMTHREDILLRCKSELVKQPKLIAKYTKNIINLFDGRFEYIPMMFDQIMTKCTRKEYTDLNYDELMKIISDFALKELTKEQFTELGAILNQNGGDDSF